MNVFVLWGACWTGRIWSRELRESAISRKTGYKIFDRYKEYSRWKMNFEAIQPSTPTLMTFGS